MFFFCKKFGEFGHKSYNIIFLFSFDSICICLIFFVKKILLLFLCSLTIYVFLANNVTLSRFVVSISLEWGTAGINPFRYSKLAISYVI